MLTETLQSQPAINPEDGPAAIRPDKLSQREAEFGLVLGLLVVGLLWRLATLNNNSIAIDEALELRTARETSLNELLFYSRNWFIQPPLFFVIMHLWTGMVGMSEMAVRLFSVLMSVANIALVYWLARHWLDQRIALTTLSLLVVAPLDLYLAQSAHSYSFVGLVTTISIGLAYYLSTKPKQIWGWLAYLASLVILLYTNYLGLHVALSQLIFLGVALRRQRAAVIRVLITFALAAGAFLPYLNNALSQFNNAPSYNPLSTPFQMVTAIQYLAGYYGDLILVYLAGAVFVPCYFVGLKLLWRTNRKLAYGLLCWTWLPIVTNWFGSLVRLNFNAHVFIVSLPSFLVVVTVGVWNIGDEVPKKASKRLAYLMLTLLVAVSIISCLNYYVSYRTSDYRSAVTYIANNYQAGDLLFLANEYGYSSSIFDYYYAYILSTPKKLDYGILPAAPSKEEVVNLINGHTRIWVLAVDDGSNWAGKYVTPNLPANVRAVYTKNYQSTEQGQFTLSLYVTN
jgi:uncharacterized membrane protein